MAVNVSLQDARKVLADALANAKKYKGGVTELLYKVLTGPHITFRYIVFTGILAKATEPSVDTLSLQVKDTSPGAYDARSLCHFVVVPFERANFKKCLGGSNEPYLNKPARFMRMVSTNACRKGKDKELQLATISVLEACGESQERAKKLLEYSMYILGEIKAARGSKYSVKPVAVNETTQAIYDFCSSILKEKHEGESCALVVGVVEMFSCPELDVRVHKVNEAGASSKEVGDIDIYRDDHLVCSFEVKDKNFSREDVEFAVEKFQEAGLPRSMFVYGLDVQFDADTVHDIVKTKGEEGCFCAVVPVLDYVRLRMLGFNPALSLSEFVDKMLDVADDIRAKDETVEWIHKCYDQMTKQ